jgi:glycosyltransferase involved in cell wall biosynthesis
MRGGEKVLEGIAERFPGAEVFTLVHRRGSVSAVLEARPIHTSYVQRLPGVTRHYRKYLPLFPPAITRFDLSGFDLVISSSHCVAKGVRVPRGIPHVCYCHTPMRYIWNHFDAYFGPGRAPWWVRAAMAVTVERLRRWDVASCAGVDHFIANSRNVERRIARYYGRSADVLHPWVDHAFFTPGGEPEEYFLIVTALVPYKRVEIAVDAFARSGAPLVIAGSGPEMARLSASAPPNVHFRGWVTDDTLRELYRGCRALIFPAEEDFGIVPLEAMACGRPVVAFRGGGALETVIDGVTGIFFDAQTPESLREAIGRLDAERFDSARIRAHARRFDREGFLDRFDAIVRGVMARRVAGGRDPVSPHA